MKALLCREFGPPETLRVEEVDEPTPGPGQVVVDVRACGVSFPDVLMIHDRYQFKPPLPFSPGGEVAGTVRAVGPDVTTVAPGDAVIASTGWGGLAEQVLAGAGSVHPLPPGMDYAAAAGFLYAYGTSQYALVDRAALQPGETLLVLGAAGGVGSAAVEIGKAIGAHVIAAASSPAKLAFARELGADETVDYTTGNLREQLKELTGGRGVDVVYDPVGGELAEPALRSLAWDGRFLVVGFAAGDIPRIPLNLVLLKSARVIGVFWGAFVGRDPARHRENVATLLGWWQQSRLNPRVSATYPLERAAEALGDLAARRVQGKAVVVNS